MPTTNYNLAYIEVGQKEKEVTINTNMDAIDAKLKEIADRPGLYSVSGQTTSVSYVDLPLSGLPWSDDALHDLDIILLARNVNNNTENKSFKLDGAFTRGNGPGTLTAVSTAQGYTRVTSAGTTTWNAWIGSTNNAVFLRVTGEPGKTINWSASIRMAKVVA